MSSGSWLNNDGLYLQFGTQKAVPETAGEFRSPGGNRSIELTIDLTKLTSTAAIQSNTLFFPSGPNIFIEQVELITETGAVGGTSFSVGLIQADRATIPSNYSTALINAEVIASVTTAGQKITYNEATTHAGGLIGSSPSATTAPYYISALSSGTFSAGSVRVRVFYHGVGTISS